MIVILSKQTAWAYQFAGLFQTRPQILDQFFELRFARHGFAPQRQDKWDPPP